MNRRGILRIAEATIAILIIISFLILVQVRGRSADSVDFGDRVYEVLEEIAKNPAIRQEIFIEDNFDESRFVKEDSQIYIFARERIPESYLTVEIRACEEIDKICSLGEFVEGEVYTGQRVIVPGVEGTGFRSKKLAIFVYEK
ncbi:hypothetical protein CO038_04870 [Candidatus Pacearchaeota archaeon CG_4_9_14_0_2_um_filter_39_13]|nr:hypothetical protein [Candidatus Pacearchaeota archaeon]OIO43691.1 MAG: hypothetical protein AUJ64_01890 [Candidatus Pacearchaeota archaeon CG1_02_39_14]PJC44228.1 MAG: hypothetical protein CO038_04870 [Candidatus Pacearchaeota archaeon CG_4_9_14_0_2_um_filter_39_13]